MVHILWLSHVSVVPTYQAAHFDDTSFGWIDRACGSAKWIPHGTALADRSQTRTDRAVKKRWRSTATAHAWLVYDNKIGHVRVTMVDERSHKTHGTGRDMIPPIQLAGRSHCYRSTINRRLKTLHNSFPCFGPLPRGPQKALLIIGHCIVHLVCEFFVFFLFSRNVRFCGWGYGIKLLPNFSSRRRLKTLKLSLWSLTSGASKGATNNRPWLCSSGLRFFRFSFFLSKRQVLWVGVRK